MMGIIEKSSIVLLMQLLSTQTAAVGVNQESSKWIP